MKRAALIVFSALAAIGLLPGLGAAAGPSGLQMSIVPADAQWVLHLDMERLTSSAIFNLLTEAGKGADIQQKVGQFAGKFKMDPLKDIKGVTVFGESGAGEEPVVAIFGNFDQVSLLGLLKTEASTKEIPYDKHTLYSWQGEHYGVFVNNSLVLIAEKEADIRAALDVLDGKARNISESPLAARLRKEPAGAIVEFAVADIRGLTGGGKGTVAGHEMPAMLSQMKSVDGAISEIGDKLNLKIEIAAESAQVAQNLEQAIRGIIALANLQFTSGDAQLITQGISVKVDDERVRIEATYLVPELQKMIQEHRDHKAEAAPAPENKK